MGSPDEGICYLSNVNKAMLPFGETFSAQIRGFMLFERRLPWPCSSVLGQGVVFAGSGRSQYRGCYLPDNESNMAQSGTFTHTDGLRKLTCNASATTAQISIYIGNSVHFTLSSSDGQALSGFNCTAAGLAVLQPDDWAADNGPRLFLAR